MIEVMENVELSITSHQKYKLFLFLCNAERYKENLPAIEQLLLIVLGLKVKLRLEVHEIDEPGGCKSPGSSLQAAAG